jgi:hypothetical protein
MPTQEIKGTNFVPTAVSSTETAVTQEPVVTVEPTATESPTQVPSMTPSSCVTLLTPPKGAEIPAMGKVTFSWSPLNEATFYVLTIILPSGQTAAFETKQTFRNQYMEAFSTGGSYQWKVTALAQDRKRSEICSSELATFSKPASAQPPPNRIEDGKKK